MAAILDGDALGLVLAVVPLEDRCQALRTARSWATMASDGTVWAVNVFRSAFHQRIQNADVTSVIRRAGVHLIHLEFEWCTDDMLIQKGYHRLTIQAFAPLVEATALKILVLRDCSWLTCAGILSVLPPGLQLQRLSVGGCDGLQREPFGQQEILQLRERVAPEFRNSDDDPLSGLDADVCRFCEPRAQDGCVVCSADDCRAVICGKSCTWDRGPLGGAHRAFKCDRCEERFCLGCMDRQQCDRCEVITCDRCKPDGFTDPGFMTCSRCRETWCGECSTDWSGMLEFVWTSRGSICPDCAERCKDDPEEEDPWDGDSGDGEDDGTL